MRNKVVSDCVRRGSAGAQCAAVVALLMTAASSARGDEPRAGAVGAPMPPVSLPSVGDQPLDQDALDGKVVLYEFWATWCTPCRVQIEILKELQTSARAAGVEFVGIATGEPRDLVVAHLSRERSPYPVLLDEDEELGMALRILGLPTLVIVDRSGKIAWRATGLTDRPTLEAAFREAGVPLADDPEAATAASAATSP